MKPATGVGDVREWLSRQDPAGIARKAREALNAQWRLRAATTVAPTVRVLGRPWVANYGTMIVRDRALLVSHVARIELAVNDGGSLDIGERTFVNYGASLSASERITVGPDCHIGPHCMVLDNDFHRLEPERRLERPESEPIDIGPNVWLAARVIVMKGVTIGEGSVVGAGSIVTRDVPARTLVAGSPATVLREL